MDPTQTLNLHFQHYLLREWKKNQYITYYAFTVSPHSKCLSKASIEESVTDMLNICKNIISCKYIYETSAKNKIHIHGILCSKSKSKFFKLRKHPLVKFHMVEYIHNEQKWIHYMSKNKPDKIYAHYHDKDGQQIQPITNLTWYLF